MSDSGSGRQKGSKSKKGSDQAGGESGVPYRGTTINTTTMYTMAFGEDEEVVVSRPVPVQKSKAKGKEKKTRVIDADYSYDYDFAETRTGRPQKSAPKTVKQPTRADLRLLLDTLTVDTLQTALARHDGENASPLTLFETLAQELVQHLFTAKPITYESNQEHWQSINLPYSDTSEDVVQFLTSFVRNRLDYAQQVAAANYLIRNYIKTSSSKEAASSCGLRLFLQVLLRESPWAFLDSFSEIKSALNKVQTGNYYVVPSNLLPIIVFIGAQQFASDEDDAPFAAFRFAVEILGYTGFHKQDSMCLEFIASAYHGYRKTYGSKVNKEHLRLSTPIADRALLDLSKIVASKNTGPFQPILPIIQPLRELILELAVLSADSTRIAKFWFSTFEHSADVWKAVLARVSPQSIEEFDEQCKKTVVHLAQVIGQHLSGKGLPKTSNKVLAPIDLELKPVLTKFLDRFQQSYKLPSDTDQHKDADHKSANRKKGARKGHHSGSKIVAIFKFLVFCAVAYFIGTYIWTHHVTDTTKTACLQWTEATLNSTRPYVDRVVSKIHPYWVKTQAAVQPHLSSAYNTAHATLSPHVQSAHQAVLPHYEAALEAIHPHYTSAVDAVTPYYETIKPHVVKAWTIVKPVLLELEKKLVAASAEFATKMYYFHVWLFARIVEITRYLIAVASPVVSHYWEVVRTEYQTHAAPVLANWMKQAEPVTQPMWRVIQPIWLRLSEVLSDFGKVLNDLIMVQ